MGGFRESLFFPNSNDDLPVFNGAGFLAQVVDGVAERHARALRHASNGGANTAQAFMVGPGCVRSSDVLLLRCAKQ